MFMSDMGGLTGLLLGLSIFSFFDVMAKFGEWIYNRFFKAKRHPKKKADFASVTLD